MTLKWADELTPNDFILKIHSSTDHKTEYYITKVRNIENYVYVVGVTWDNEIVTDVLFIGNVVEVKSD